MKGGHQSQAEDGLKFLKLTLKSPSCRRVAEVSDFPELHSGLLYRCLVVGVGGQEGGPG